VGLDIAWYKLILGGLWGYYGLAGMGWQEVGENVGVVVATSGGIK